MADGETMDVRERDEIRESEGTRQGTYFRPHVDIYETDEALSLFADVPGCDPDDFEINLEDSKLTITAATQQLGENWNPIYEEYREGHFFREFRLGKEIDRETITATFDNGVLTVELPKQKRSEPRQIEIE